MESRAKQEVHTAERTTAVRHQDNLKVEGKFEGKASQGMAAIGERAAVVKHQDNLKMEGRFEGRERHSVGVAKRAVQVRHSDNLR